jgi:hypothetical protein
MLKNQRKEVVRLQVLLVLNKVPAKWVPCFLVGLTSRLQKSTSNLANLLQKFSASIDQGPNW